MCILYDPDPQNKDLLNMVPRSSNDAIEKGALEKNWLGFHEQKEVHTGAKSSAHGL